MKIGQHTTALIKLLQANGYRHHLYDVFRDFVELAACSLANACDPVGFDVREAQYMRTVGKYSSDEVQRFPMMLGELVEAMAEEPGDVLGKVFGELEQGNAARGQFFTPIEICKLMAGLSMDPAHVNRLIAERGFITVQEPAVGAGAMVIALALHLQDIGINYQQHMHVTCVDVDARAVHMAYVQFTLLGIPAIVVLGNTLTLEQHEVWHTPAHIMGLWDTRLRRGYALGSAMDLDGQSRPVRQAPVLLPRAAQLDLFAEQAA